MARKLFLCALLMIALCSTAQADDDGRAAEREAFKVYQVSHINHFRRRSDRRRHTIMPTLKTLTRRRL